MTPKQARFVAEYLIDLNATQAAIRAGYSPKTANREGSRLLSNVDIARAVAAKQAEHLSTADLTAARVLEEYRRLAFFDTRTLFTPEGSLKPVTDLTPEQGAALASIEVLIKNAEAGDGQTDRVHKIRLWDKTKALDSLAKHFGLLKETVEHTGGVVVRWEGTA